MPIYVYWITLAMFIQEKDFKKVHSGDVIKICVDKLFKE